MTFSARAKAELCRVPIKKRCCAVAEAYGVEEGTRISYMTINATDGSIIGN